MPTIKKANVGQVAELVRLIADGVIPEEEVRALISQPRTTEAKKARLTRRSLRAAREAGGAAKVEGAYERSEAYAAIYGALRDS